LVKELPDHATLPGRVLMQDLYREVAAELKVPVPNDDMKPFALQIDKVVFDPRDPAASLKRYVA
jgi:nitrate/nitrite transport system substrate-binding protein